MQRWSIGRGVLAMTLIWLVVGVSTSHAQKGLILDQQLEPDGRGYTVIRVWGSHYEMGQANATLLGDHIVAGVNQTKSYLGGLYNSRRSIMAGALFMPPEIEDELDGAVASLALTHPAENIDKLDLKVAATAGEWLYGCRSHTCWGRYVADPVKTLSTRRLDFPTVYSTMNHHVLCARCPDDGSVSWVNMGWAGIGTVATGVNEFGAIASLHDYNCSTDFAAGRMPRMIACRYALTYANDPDISTHLYDTYMELRNYEVMTGSFINYYVPEGHGGVMACNPYYAGPDFYNLRKPQAVWHHGEAMITTNTWTDGTTTPTDENFGADAYYNDETPKTLESHWGLLADSANGLHLLSIAYRGRADMTVWADGRLDGIGRTPRMEWEWWQLFGAGDMNCDGTLDFGDINPFVQALSDQAAYEATYPDCRWLNADVNGDGTVDFGDINPFVTLLSAAL